MKLPEKWSGWSIGRLIGEGAYGSVYTVRHEDGRKEAVKIIAAPDDPENVRQCMREIRIMKKLSDGPHIVRVTDFAVEEGEEGLSNIFIRMELLTDINTWMDAEHRSEQEVVRMGAEICEALGFCHAQHLIHRDIKPENIFIHPESGEFKLGDFGLARYLDPEESELTIAGTDSYMAPEVAHGEEYGPDADLYSLGLVMYRLLNRNRFPFLDPDKQLLTYKERMEAGERRLAGEEVPPPAEASAETFEVIQKACAPDRAGRYHTAAEMKTDLQKLQKLLESGKQTRSAGAMRTGGEKREKIRKAGGENAGRFAFSGYRRAAAVTISVAAAMVAAGGIFIGSGGFGLSMDDGNGNSVTEENSSAVGSGSSVGNGSAAGIGAAGGNGSATGNGSANGNGSAAENGSADGNGSAEGYVSEAYEEANGDVYVVNVAYYLPIQTDDHEVYLAEPGVILKVLSPTGEIITQSGVEGTVNLDYVRSESEETSTTYSGLVNGSTPDEDTLCWLTSAASVYAQEDESGTVLAQAERGTPFYVLETGTEMSEIVFLDSGETGWIRSDLLTTDPENTIGITFAGYIRSGDSVL